MGKVYHQEDGTLSMIVVEINLMEINLMDVLFVLDLMKLDILLQAPCASVVLGIPLIIMIIHRKLLKPIAAT